MQWSIFQKRGLPHAHILLWLDTKNKYPTPSLIDKIITVEIPDKEIDPLAYAAVSQFMMHGPCGKAATSAPCMQDHKCKKHFPKKYISETIIEESGFAVYQRRADDDRWVMKNRIKLDNAYVVPYNRNLLVKYQAHINVEWCNRGRSIKYLFKYITKGPDHASISLQSSNIDANTSNKSLPLDEIQYYLNCRYLSAPEAIWRIYGFDIHHRVPAVERLPFHLPEQQPIIYKDTDDLRQIINHVEDNQTKFMGWMEANKLYPEARKLTYAEFPSKFVWKADERKWKIREKGRSIGRVVYAHPTTGERFYLRLLLNTIRGPQCFQDILKHDGILYDSFRETCTALRLLDNDMEWQYVLIEASYTSSGRQMRQMFANLLLFCQVANPKKLWEDNWMYLAEGILEMQRKLLRMSNFIMSDQQLQNQTLAEIEYLLRQNGKSLSKFPGMPQPDSNLMKHCLDKLIGEELNFDREQLREEHEKLFKGLNVQQRAVYDDVIESVNNKTGGLYFLYGHGGTGKTYVWKSIITRLRSEGKIVLAIASSGIASVLLPKGRTAHSRFQIPILLKENSTCRIKQGTPEANLMKKSSLIIWDEAPMVHRHAFEAVDRTLQDILLSQDEMARNKPFGGLTVVLGGDFRQILSVLPGGNKHDILNASISSSRLWNECKLFSLTDNMRLQQKDCQKNGMTIADFSKWVLKLGNGDLQIIEDVSKSDEPLIKIPEEFIIHSTGDGMDDIISQTYPNLLENYSNAEYLQERTILTPMNENVDIINDII